MKPKAVAVFAGVTAIMVIAAIVAVLGQRSPTSIPKDREYAFSGLIDKENDAVAIKIVSAKHTFNLKRMDKGWGLAEKGGYSVSYEKVKSTIVGLAQLRLLEAKTSDPERYDRLEVRDPSVKDAKSRRAVVIDAAGKTLADVIAGRRNPSLFGGSGGGIYLRRGDEKQVWLASGSVDIGAAPNDWLIRDIVNIDAEDVKRLVIRQPAGAELVIHKADKKQEKFTVDNIPAGRKLKSENEGKDVAGGLWRLSLEDVKPAKDRPLPEKLHKTEFVTFGGLKVQVDVAIIDKEYWGRFSASTVDGGDEKAKEEAAKKAKEINDRVNGWHYLLSVGEGERLTTKIQDLLEAPAKS